MSKFKLLIVEDDDGLCRQYRWAFPDQQLFVANTRQAGLAIIERERPPVAVIDLGLPPDPDGATEGLALLREALKIAPGTKVIVATGNEEMTHALEAVHLGAFDFYRKPIDITVLKVILERAFTMHTLEEENERLRAQSVFSEVSWLITGDDNMLKLCRSIDKLAGTNATVLLLGESGTGKELFARALHELGSRSKHPFVPINCAAIPETLLESELFGHERGAFTGAVRQIIGKVEAAHRGTLFLDEIGDVPPSLQVKLLRFLQERTIERIGGRRAIDIDVRIVCATHQDLSVQIQKGEFREDLFYRLNEVTVRIPPLRERAGDPALLASYFLNRFANEIGRRIKGFSADSIASIAAHAWPGNVRELEKRVKRAVIMAEGELIEPGDLELSVTTSTNVGLDIRKARAKAEREAILQALAQANGIVASAAKLLGVSRPTLYALMAAHGLGTLSEPLSTSGAVSPQLDR